MKKPVYLDYQATTPCDPRVVEAMMPYFSDCFANAHSEHCMGHQAARAVHDARQQVADSLGVTPQEVVFTSGATESNNIALQGGVRFLSGHGHSARRVITVATEHKSVLETVRSFQKMDLEPVMLPVQSDGLVDPDQLRVALQTPTLLVSVMAANNETGVIQDIPVLSGLAHEYGALFHCDIAQAFGKITPFSFLRQWDIDLASISGHKIYGPKGIGALYVRHKPRVRLSPLFYGGYQERGIRSGTLPVPLIVGLGHACQLMRQEHAAESRRLFAYKWLVLEALQERIPGLKVNGNLGKTLPACMNLRFPDITALDLLAKIPHLCLSTGSACNHASAPSYVLLAMGLTEQEALSSIRLSFGRMTTESEVQEVIAVLSQAWHDIMVEIGCKNY